MGRPEQALSRQDIHLLSTESCTLSLYSLCSAPAWFVGTSGAWWSMHWLLRQGGHPCTGPFAQNTWGKVCASSLSVTARRACATSIWCVFVFVAPRRLSQDLWEACHGRLTSGGRPSGEAAIVQHHGWNFSRSKMPHVLWTAAI